MAANEFEESIPISVAEALFGFGDSGRFEVSSDIPDEFPAFEIPDGFTTLGSAYFMRSLRVALSTSIDIEEAVEAIEAALLDEDWEIMPNPNPFPNRTGFVTQNQIESRARILCHDDFGQLTLSSKSRVPENQIILSVSVGFRRSWSNCAQFRAQMEQQTSMMQSRGSVGIQQYMPRLTMPESGSAGQIPAFMLGSSSSSNNSAESDVELEIDWSIEEVFRHFAEQMIAQEWALDAESVGSLSGSGTWTRRPESDMNLIGNLNVVSLGEERFQLKLTVEALGRGSSGIGNIIRN